MNKETTELIEKLANKLGTTAEHLWGVLIKQAPISSTIDILIFIFFAIVFLFLCWFANKMWNNFTKKDEEKYLWSCFIPSLLAIIILICLICCLFNSDIILAGFFNPEYWAYKQIIK